MRLKPELQLRHQDAEETRNMAPHQENLQVLNGANLQEVICATKVKAIRTGLSQCEPVGSHVMLPHDLDAR